MVLFQRVSAHFNLFLFSSFFIFFNLFFSSQQLILNHEPLIKKKNAIQKLIDWSEVRSDALFTLVAMATSILLTLAFNKPLSECWKRAFHSTSFIFHVQINTDMFFMSLADTYYICNLNVSEFVFKMQHIQPAMVVYY